MRMRKSAGRRSKSVLFFSLAVPAALASILLLAGVLFAAQLSWSSNGPSSSVITSLAADPRNPGVVYATSYKQGGMYKTTNFGQSWANISGGFPSTNADVVVIDPANSAIVYVGTNQGIYKSVNAGASWGPSGLPQFVVLSLAVVPQTPAIIYAGTSGRGIHKSTNSGSSWTDITVGINHLSVWCIAVNAQNANNVYIGTVGGGVYRSQNAGQSWAQTNVGFPDNVTIASLSIDESNPSVMYAGTRGQGIYKSTNAGQSWSASIAGLPGNTHTVWSLLLEPGNSSTLYAAVEESGIFRSTNGGARWSDFNSGFTVAVKFFNVAADRGNPITLYSATDGYGVWQHTTNSSANTTTTTTPTTTTTSTTPTTTTTSSTLGTTTTTILLSGTPQGSLDTPLDGATVSNNVTIDGWAFIQAGNVASLASRVELMVDGTPAMVLTRSKPRGDVQSAFPAISLPTNVGVDGIWDSRTVADGPHTLQLRIFDASNNSGLAGSRRVTTQNGIMPTTTTTTASTTTTRATTPSTTSSTSTSSSSTSTSTTTSTTTTNPPNGQISMDFPACGGSPGGNFILELNQQSSKNPSELQFTLLFDESVMSFLGASAAYQALGSGKTVTSERQGTGNQRISVSGGSQTIGDGPLIKVEFKVNSSARSETKSRVMIRNGLARDPAGTSYPLPNFDNELEILSKPMLSAISPRTGAPGVLMVLTGMNFGRCAVNARVLFRSSDGTYQKEGILQEAANRRAVVLIPSDVPTNKGNLKVSLRISNVLVDASQYGNFLPDPSVPYSSLSATLEEPKSLDASALPSGAAIDSQTNIAYIADNVRRTVTAINLTTGAKVDTSLPTGNPVRLAVDPVRGQVVVTTQNNYVVVLKRQSSGSLLAVGQPVQVGSSPLGVAIDVVRNRAVVANSGSNSVSIIDLNTRQRLGSDIAVGREPVAVAIDGNLALVTNSGDNSLSVINLDTRTVISTEQGIGSRPTSIEVLPETRTALIGSNNGLVVYNTETQSKTQLLAGQSVDGIAVHSSTGVVEVVNNATGTMTTITPSIADSRNPDQSIVGTQPLDGGSARGIAINPLTNLGIVALAATANGTLEQGATGGFSRLQMPPSLNFPRLLGGGSNEYQQLAAIAISNSSVDAASLQATAISLNGQLLQGNVSNPFNQVLGKQEQVSKLDFELLGESINQENYWLKVITPNPGLKAFFMMGDFFNSTPSMLVGAEEAGQLLTDMILPAVPRGHQVYISLINPFMLSATVNLDLISNAGLILQSASRTIARYGAMQVRLEEIFSAVASGQLDSAGGGYVRLRSSMPLRGYQQFTRAGTLDPAGLNSQSGVTGSRELVFSHFVNGLTSGYNYETRLALINLEANAQTVTINLYSDKAPATSTSIQLPAQGRTDVSVGQLFGLSGESQGWLRAQSQGKMAGYLTYATPQALAAVTSLAEPRTQLTFSHVAEEGTGYFTGLAIVNTNTDSAQIKIEVFRKDGTLAAATDEPVVIRPNERVVKLLNEFFKGSPVKNQAGGYVRVTSNVPVHGIEIFATGTLSAMANVPAQ